MSDRVRISLGCLVAAIAVGGAVYLHSGLSLGTDWRVSDRTNDGTLLEASSAVLPGAACDHSGSLWHEADGPACMAMHYRTSWQTPVAILVAAVGVGTSVTIVARHKRVA